LRTTFIVGFPGETDAEFDELVAFAKAKQFERVGVFPYSVEPGTPATRLDGHLPEELKRQRRDWLMEVQQKIAFGWSQRQVGRETEVIVDGSDPEVPNHFVARGYADAPEIDAVVRVKGKNLRPGDIVRVKMTAADGYDLVGRAIGAGR
jgi:ribosomal protein S12 methylthiotransferase